MTTRSSRKRFLVGLIAAIILTNAISCLLTAFVLAPHLRNVRAAEEARTLECRQQAASEYLSGDATFDELDAALSACGGYPLR